MYLLDTNIISDLVRNPEGAVTKRIIENGEAEIVTSIVVACELRFGAIRRDSERLTDQLEKILAVLPVLALDGSADLRYGQLRTDLERQGLPIGANDMLIAAHALALEAVLVTDNLREFERVPGLTVENWLRD